MGVAVALATVLALAAGVAGNAHADGGLAFESDGSRPPGNDPEARRFDFWLGEWEVVWSRWQDGEWRAVDWTTNRISRVLGGCALPEEYEAPGGIRGLSLSFYDRENGRWHQTWIDNSGHSLIQHGEWADGAMDLRDKNAGREPFDWVTWTPLEGGRVRQAWRSAPARGGEGRVVFDGIYSPAREPRSER